jgi:hypothetical protein
LLSHIFGGPRRHDLTLRTETAESASLIYADVNTPADSSVLEIQVARLLAVSTVALSILVLVVVRATTLSSHDPLIS